MTEQRRRQYYEETYNPVFEGLEGQENLEGLDGEASVLEPLPPLGQTEPKAGGRRARAKEKAQSAAAQTTRKRQAKRKEAQPRPAAAAPGSLREASGKVKSFFTSQTFRWLAGIFIGGLGVYMLVAFISYFANCVQDQAAIANSAVGSLPDVGNAGGEGGARLSELLINESFGVGSFVVILWLIAISLKLLAGKPRFKTVNFTIKCLVALITLSLIVGLLTIGFNSGVNWGGYHGRYVNEFIVKFIGWSGAWILCLALVATFFVICLRDFVNWILRKKAQLDEKRRQAAELKAERLRRERELEEMLHQERLDAIRAGEARAADEPEPEESLVTFGTSDTLIDPSLQAYEIEDESDDSTDTPAGSAQPDYSAYMPKETAAASADVQPQSDSVTPIANAAPIEPSASTPAAAMAPAMPQPQELSHAGEAAPSVAQSPSTPGSSADESPASDADSTAAAAGQESGASESPEASDADKEGEKELEMVVNVNQISQTTPQPRPAAANGSIKHMYKFPSPMLLREGDHKVTVDIEEQQANKERIRETLKYHGIPITSIEATVGPTVTLYEIRPGQGIKISKIKNLADDIALSLAAKGVRIIAPIPGRGTVGIEVANSEPQTVSMRSIIMSRKYNESRYRLPVAIGSTIGNDVYMADLTKMPHLLVAGATGQGKSVGLNAIIASLLYKKRPDELKFVMIDPKEVEFSLYAMIEQHYLAKLEDSDAIVTDMTKVVDTLSSLCVEMDNRYKLLRMAQVRNIEEYNAKIAQGVLSEMEGHRFMPYIVLVVDEFADLIMTSGKEVETPIARLAQKARAIGIHVIIATQRPSTNVITGIIKANFPVRIAFRVSSSVDSKTILDTTGAQSLIGRGDMLISNNSEMVRVQCAFIDTPEVEAICEYISRQPFNAGPYILPEPLSAAEHDGGGGQITGGAIHSSKRWPNSWSLQAWAALRAYSAVTR